MIQKRTVRLFLAYSENTFCCDFPMLTVPPLFLMLCLLTVSLCFGTLTRGCEVIGETSLHFCFFLLVLVNCFLDDNAEFNV